MTTWFEGEGPIACSIDDVEAAVSDPARLFVDVVRLMPGLTDVELEADHDDAVRISTNEGLMERTNIRSAREADAIVMTFDERYTAGSKVTTTAHFEERFESISTGVRHILTISNVEAEGVLGFLYRRFGSSKTGNAFLSASKTTLESPHQ